MDEVLDNLTEVWVDELNWRYGTSVVQDDLSNWDMMQAFPSLTSEQVWSPLNDRLTFVKMRPPSGAQEFVENVQNSGHELYIVTASHYKTIDVKMLWLFNYFPTLDWKHVVVTSNKQMVDGDVLIDDAVHNLIGGRYKSILLDKPWNRCCKDSLIHRVQDLHRAFEYIQELAQCEGGIK